MSQVVLNSAIGTMDHESALFALYTRFYDGITTANNTDAPDYVLNPVYEKNPDGTDKIDEDGVKVVDQNAIQESIKECSEIQTKNAAYMLANAIVSTISPTEGAGVGIGFLARTGDTMQGNLGALHGFEAGADNKKIFETVVEGDNQKAAIVSGVLRVSDKTEINGQLNLSDVGIYFRGIQSIWCDYEDRDGDGDEDAILNFASKYIHLAGDVDVDGSIKIGDVLIGEDGLSVDGKTYYHAGNSNKADVDWSMRNANVCGDLIVVGNSLLRGRVVAGNGFDFNFLNKSLLRSDSSSYHDANGNTVEDPYVKLDCDLSIINRHGINLDGNYIVWSHDSAASVSLSAPGAVMNLGDNGIKADGASAPTRYISLKADLRNDSGDYAIITHDGTGNFKNGFSAGAANALSASIQTYYTDKDDYGVVVDRNLRLGNTSGPYLCEERKNDCEELVCNIPYSVAVGDVSERRIADIRFYPSESTSSTYNIANDSSLVAFHINTDTCHFSFDKPVEAECYAVKSSSGKTRLTDGVLFLDDGKFIEGVVGGLRLSKDTLFDGDLFSYDSVDKSRKFSSGFAGSGWAILEDATAGGTHATFDSLTIRKKMRVYEFEVQKISATNGSLWISDSCSGDEVRELN